jgi:hypothetical protein
MGPPGSRVAGVWSSGLVACGASGPADGRGAGGFGFGGSGCGPLAPGSAWVRSFGGGWFPGRLRTAGS